MDPFELVRRNQVAIESLAVAVRSLAADPTQLDLLRTTQIEIASRIRRAEGATKTKRTKSAELKSLRRSGRLPRAESVSLKRATAQLENSIASYRFLAYVWRCFGDALAFIYLDRYALKHTYFDTTSYVAKPSPGELSGKAGLALEWKVVNQALALGAPAMLCDLTNTLRHGDVCILTGPDPQLIEVKSSGNTNARVERQLDSLIRLGDFFAHDEATDFRGVPHVVRTALRSAPVDHSSTLEQLIKDARKAGGISQGSPEAGLQYICLRDAEPDELPARLDTLFGERHWIGAFLNEAKWERAWQPYYPFTLSLREPRGLFEFIQGRISLFVAIDVDTIKEGFEAAGFEVAFVAEGPWAIWLRTPDKSFTGAISRPLLNRIFYEFLSVAWFVGEQVALSLQTSAQPRAAPPASANGPAANPGKFGPPPDLDALFRKHRL
jgi:hypothetical protein